LYQENFHFILPANIETLVLNNITNGGAASFFDLNRVVFPRISLISLEGNNLCGPIPGFWINSGVKVSLKNHAKTLWCDPIISEGCGIDHFD
jgi:hypothetical protein